MNNNDMSTALRNQIETIRRKRWCSENECRKCKNSFWCNMCRLLASAANYIDDMNEQLRAQEKMAKDTCDLLTRQLLEATNAADAMREDVVDLANDLQLGHVCETCSRRENCLKNKTGWLSNKQCVDWEYKKFAIGVVNNCGGQLR